MIGTLVSFLWVLLMQVVARKMGLYEHGSIVAFGSFAGGLVVLLAFWKLAKNEREGDEMSAQVMHAIAMLTGVFLGYFVQEPDSVFVAVPLFVALMAGNFVVGLYLWSNDFVHQRTDRQHFWRYCLGIMVAQGLSCIGLAVFAHGAYQGSEITAGCIVAFVVSVLFVPARVFAHRFDVADEKKHDLREKAVNEQAEAYGVNLRV